MHEMALLYCYCGVLQADAYWIMASCVLDTNHQHHLHGHTHIVQVSEWLEKARGACQHARYHTRVGPISLPLSLSHVAQMAKWCVMD
jgi:hypothetical protein